MLAQEVVVAGPGAAGRPAARLVCSTVVEAVSTR